MPTTVIDSLVLELGLDPTKFTQQQREAVQSLRSLQQEQATSAKAIEEQTRRTANVLTEFRRTAMQATAVFLGGMGIQQFVSYVTSLDASAGRLGRTMNMSAADVTIWQGAVKQAGGTAEDANSALSGLSADMNRFALTGQSAMLPVLSRLGISLFDQNRNLKTAGQLWLDIADSIQGMDSAKATSFLSMIPGATQGMTNLALLGPGKMREYLEVQREIGAATKESAEQSAAFERELAKVQSTAVQVGRTFLGEAFPAILNGLAIIKSAISFLQLTPAKAAEGATKGIVGSIYERLGKPQALRDALNRGILAKTYGTDFFLEPESSPESSPPGPPAGAGESRSTVPSRPPTPSEIEAYVRAGAARRGINPDIAVQVAKSEGMFAYKYSPSGQSFVPGEQSFGPFQLNYAKSGRSLGDQFTRKTGLDARDSSTWREQVDFSLDTAGKSGWGGWHGWKGDRFAGIPAGDRAGSRGAGGGGGVNVNIGNLTVNAPQAKDAAGIARELGPQLQRSITTGAANMGPN